MAEVQDIEIKEEVDGYDRLLNVYRDEEQRIARGEDLKRTVIGFFQEDSEGNVLRKENPKYLIDRNSNLAGSEVHQRWIRGGYSDLGVPIVAKIKNIAMGTPNPDRFKGEARKTGTAEHPSIITAYDFLRHQKWGNNEVEVLMLRQAEKGRISNLSNEKISPNDFFKIVDGIGKALTLLHEQGKTHGDLYERNVMLNENNEVKIIDLDSYDYGSDDVGNYITIVFALLTGEQQPYPGELIPSEVKYRDMKRDLDKRGLVTDEKKWQEFLDLYSQHQKQAMKIEDVHRRLTEIFAEMKS